MGATITSKYRVNKTKAIVDRIIDDIENIYFFAGRCKVWSNTTPESPDNPSDSFDSLVEAYDNMLFMKKITGSDCMLCVPRYNWTSGTVYEKYKSSRTMRDLAHLKIIGSSIYCVNSAGKVYLCLNNNSGVESTFEPTSTSTQRFTTADGYVWKFLYDLTYDISTKFLVQNWIPVPYVSSDMSANQIAVESAAAIEGGTVDSITVINGGTGYSVADTATIQGDGTGAAVSLVVNGGAITEVSVSNPGSGYTKADVIITTANGINSVLEAEIAPVEGHGKNAINDLDARFILFSGSFISDETTNFSTVNSYRQIGLLANPTDITDNPLSGSSYSTTTKITFEALLPPDTFLFGGEIEGRTSGATAVIFNRPASVSDGTLEVVNIVNGTGGYFTDEEIYGDVSEVDRKICTITSVTDPFTSTIKKYSGDILYLENILPVLRAEGQTEKFSFVIEN